jgi:4-hydroxy-L-threonine phosphate dehydrogenase PdxA
VQRRRLAIPIGDPAGIGCEVVLKALRHPRVRERCAPVIVGDAALIESCNAEFGIDLPLREDLAFSEDAISLLDVPVLDHQTFRFGAVAAGNGRALLAYAEAAIGLALDGTVDGVVAAPHNQSSIKAADIAFDGYPGLLARLAGVAEDDIHLMVVSQRFRIAHVTLHLSVRDALARIERGRILNVIVATDAALRRMGIANPRIAVSGLNPHAGEGGLFGHEEQTDIAPAIADAQAHGIDAAGPFGADVMLARGGYDAYVVMLHDQGHVPIKLEPGGAAFSIGAPILFATVAHGSAHDIAGKNLADPSSMVNALLWSSGIELPRQIRDESA